jgi:hypothetical protein
MEYLPDNVYELIDLLEKEFPEKCPELDETEREIFLYKGKVELIKFLKQLKDYQESTKE